MSTSIAGPKPKTATRRLPREQRRQAILAGATQAFARAGFAATSMSDVASASGITQLIVYRHFESKADLYRAVLECRVLEEEAFEALLESLAGSPR